MAEDHDPNQTPSLSYATAYGNRARTYRQILDPTIEPVARRLVDLGSISEGTKVLDVATGTGLVARMAQSAGASVDALDIAPGMIEVARDTSPSSIRYRVGDVAELPFSDGTFHVVTCGFGLSHLPDVPRVLNEVHRVLRPGGVLVESSWGAEADNNAFDAVLGVLNRYSNGQVHAFGAMLDEATWADTDRGCEVLRQAGFSSVTVVVEPVSGTYRSPGDALAWTLAWPDYGETADRLDAAARAAFEQDGLEAIGSSPDLRWSFSINYYRAVTAG